MDELKKVVADSFADTAKVMAVGRVYFYGGREDWPNYARSTLHYGNTVGAADWQTMYETGAYLKHFASDRETMKIGAQIMDKVLKLRRNYEHLCIYARLQAKAGDNAAALKAAREAVEIAQTEGRDSGEARALIAELTP